MTSVADEGHLDPLAETSQGRSRQELRCLCKQTFSVFTFGWLVYLCACACVLCGKCVRLWFISLQWWGWCGTAGYCLVMMRHWAVVISYGCQILGTAPYHLLLTHWDDALHRASSLVVT